MPGWIGPTVALSLFVIAIVYLGIVIALALAMKKFEERGAAIARELHDLRRELTPALQAINRFSESGAEVADIAREEMRSIVHTAQQVRLDVERGVKRAKRRLADFEAVVDVVQEEVEESALDITTAMRTVRTGAGMIGRLRRLVLPRRRGS